MNVKVFNLMSGVNDERFLLHHESCESNCELNEAVYSSKLKLNYNNFWCEGKDVNTIICLILICVIAGPRTHVKLPNI